MNSGSDNNSSNSLLKELTAKNAQNLRSIESAQPPKAVMLPYDRREAELKLLRTAIEFQPALYRMIEELATYQEMAEYVLRIEKIEEEFMNQTIEEFSGECQRMIDQMKTISSQDGKSREAFISDCSSMLKEERQSLLEQTDKLRRRLRWILISTLILSAAVSGLVSYLVCRSPLS